MLRMLENNWVLRSTYGLKNVERWRKCHNDKFHHWYSSVSVTGVIKSRRLASVLIYIGSKGIKIKARSVLLDKPEINM